MDYGHEQKQKMILYIRLFIVTRLLPVISLCFAFPGLKSRSACNISSLKLRTMLLSTKLTYVDIDESLAKLTLPELIVFDLDMCLWSPEMYTLNEIPNKGSVLIGKLGEIRDAEGMIMNGVTGVKSGHEIIKLFPAALHVLQRFYLGFYGSNLRIAAASSADTPLAVSIGRSAMGLIEVLPGVTLRDVFMKGWPSGFEGNLQIGRTHPLTSNKSLSHFPILRVETGIEYSKMIFFDDCLWGDHCSQVASNCPGVVTQRTPNGLQGVEWERALNAYSQRYGSSSL